MAYFLFGFMGTHRCENESVLAGVEAAVATVCVFACLFVGWLVCFKKQNLVTKRSSSSQSGFNVTGKKEEHT